MTDDELQEEYMRGWYSTDEPRPAQHYAAMRAVAERAAREDRDRLYWVMHYVSGAEWRRLGVIYEAGCDRDALDAAIRASNWSGA